MRFSLQKNVHILVTKLSRAQNVHKTHEIKEIDDRLHPLRGL